MFERDIIVQVNQKFQSGGVRDYAILESALARAKTLIFYDRCELIDTPFVTASEIIKRHPFVDGNKRTGAAVMIAGLALLTNYKVMDSNLVAAAVVYHAAVGNTDWEHLKYCTLRGMTNTLVPGLIDAYDRDQMELVDRGGWPLLVEKDQKDA